MNNISLKQMEFLLNEKDSIDFFSLVTKDGFFKYKILEGLNKNIKIIRDIIKLKDSEEFLALNNLLKFNFFEKEKLFEPILIFFNDLESKKIIWNDDFEKKVNKIKYFFKLIKDLEKTLKSNYFFNLFKEKNMNYSLFKQITFIFDDNKIEKIDPNIVPLFNSFLILENRKRTKIIMNLDLFNYLLKIISLIDCFDRDYQYLKDCYKEMSVLEIVSINNKIILLVIKDNLKEILNKYLLLKKKLKFDKNNKVENNEINNITNKLIISFLNALGIKEDIIYKNNINNLIEKINNTKFMKIINILFQNKEALDFLFSITSQDCRKIQELAGEVHGGNNQNFLSIEELFLIEKLVESLEYIKNELKINANEYGEESIIINILNQIDEDDLEKYLNKYQQYKEFFSENLDKNKFTAEIIQKILNKSEFLILNSNVHNFKAYYKDGGIKDKILYKGFDYNYMIYLRDRALTRTKINDSLLDKHDDFITNLKKEEEIISKNSKTFVEIVHHINELIKLIKKISQKGFIFYFEDKEIDDINKNKNIYSNFETIDKISNILLLKIKIKIEKGNDYYKPLFLLNDDEYQNYYEINNAIKNIYENIENVQSNAYLKKKYINFIHGKQFQLFLDYFMNKKKNENLNYFLSYFTNKEEFNINDFDYQNQELNIKKDFILNFYQNFIDHCELFLDILLKDNKLSLEDIYGRNKIKEDFKENTGIYLNGSSNLETDIIYFYKYFTNNVPLANTLLLCKKDTTSEEILSFLYRAILCPYKIFFCLGRADYLSEEKKNFILNAIIELISRVKLENKMTSCLLIINNSLEDDLCKSLFRFKFINPLNIPQEQRDKIKIIKDGDYEKNIVIYSDHSGTGKSTFIKNQIKEEEYIYFPIGGIFTKEDTLKRLQDLNKEKSINDEKKKFLIHFDLYDTDQKSIMNDFLYSILFTKLYGQENNIFYLSKKIKIYIEIPNSFINFFEKYPILKLFPNKKLTLEPLLPLIVPEDICSNVKIVSLYLKLLKEENILPENTTKYFKADNKIDKNAIVFPFTPPDLILKDEYGYDYNKIVIKAIDENKYLTQKKCQELIMEEIYKTIKNPNYYQITTFINVLANQLIQFNRNYFLSACTILDSGRFESCSIRSLIINKFIELTRYFTQGAFTELLNEQKGIQTLINSKSNEKEKIDKANELLEKSKHESISFEKMDLALVFFHGGDNSNFFSIITNKKIDDPTYIDLLNLKNFQSGKDIIKRINIQNKKRIKLDCIEKLNDYRNFKQTDFLEELKSILDIKNPIEKKENDNNIISLKDITKDYVFTEDNFIKMCLILIRLRANIPVIMMGETGCGKTCLIRKLSEMQNNGKSLLITDNIHAGHSNEDIINFIEKEVIPKANELAKIEKLNQEKYLLNNLIYEEKKIWVFFDELNTCKSMDLLSEIICKHSYQGKKIPENIVFIGAVNPYRKSKIKKVGLIINKNGSCNETDLVYTVNPMPHSLLNYVFDFGSLNSEDEKKYIKHMVKNIIKEDDLCNFTTELIFIAQNFIREKNGISSVSLREIKRFIIFYEFFLKYLNIRKEIINERTITENENEKIKYYNLTQNEIKLYSINLSIYLGYYLRLTENDDYKKDSITIKDCGLNERGLRKILYEKLNNIFMAKSKINFLTIPEKEENFIADNVELEKGIAKNRALLENLFSLFVSINTKTPIFILGKPGCSESLSIQLISNAMKGKSSNNPFFRKYPKMYISTFQGALNSTSEGVKEVFDKARELLKVKENKEKISTLYFDEMGLAEHSPHNPLKVIHSELEYDKNEGDKQIAFIGVSNWSLDSSKMNRGLIINIPDPNEADIKTTSISIAKSYFGEKLENNIKLFFENLGSCYYKYKQDFKKNNSIKIYEDFHGNRDFYHLIKYPAIKIKEAIKNKQIIDDKYLTNLSIKGFERNFGGLIMNEDKFSSGIDLIIEKLIEYNKEAKNIFKECNYNINDKIKDNLMEISDDYLSRYLLLITRTNIGIYLLSSFLNSININENNFDNYTILIGSVFTDDIQKEEYSSKILSKIKMNMEKDTILILKDFESIYPSLYDLFNQNFIKVKEKKYARIALGNKTNSFSEVNKRFRCIIIVDQDKIPDQEIPFLNRFEKQNISFEYLMNDKQISIANELYEKCIKLVSYDEKKICLIDYDINNLLINCDEEEILGFVYMETQGKKEINEEDCEKIENKFISKISILLPQDIILILLFNKINWNDKDENKKFYNKLLDYYNNNVHNNIKSLLLNYDNERNKIIIYTFTNIIESINIENLCSYDIKSLGKIKQSNIHQIGISSIQNEYELENEIEDFLENKNLKIFILKLLPFECSTIDYLKTIIENKEAEYKSKNLEKLNKLFIFIIHLERINKKDFENNYSKNWDLIRKKVLTHSLSHLAGYNQIFIDDINGKDYLDKEHKIITLDKITKMKTGDLYQSFINPQTILLENLNGVLFFFECSFNVEEKELNKNIYINKLIELFIKDRHLIKLIDEKIMENINKKYEDNNNKSFLEKIIKEEKFSRGDICIFDLVKKILYKNYLNEFKILYLELEKNYYFSSLIFNKKEYLENNNSIISNNDENFNKIIKEIFLKNVDLINKIPENEMKIEIKIGFNFPSKNLIEGIILNINDIIINQFKENEEDFKNKYFDNEDEEFKEAKQQYENNLEIYKRLTHDNIMKNNIIKEVESKLAKGEKNKFYNLLFEDYLLTFIDKNFKGLKYKSIFGIKAFMEIILENKFDLNENNSDLEKLSFKVNWIESYSMEIISIIKMYIFLATFKKSDDLNKKIKDTISELNEEYNKLNISENSKLINRIFYITIGSLINTLIYDLNIILSGIKDQESLNVLLDNLNNIYYYILSNNNALNLNSKEIFQFHETIKVISILSFNDDKEKIEQNKKLMTDFIQKKIINENKDENEIKSKIEGPKLKIENNKINDSIEKEDTKEEKDLKNKLNNFYNYYKEKNNINFSSLFSSVLFDEFNKEFNEKYRQYILKTILDDDDLIQNNILLIKIILSEYIKPDVDNINEALDYISSEETYFPLLNDSNRDIVSKNIIKIFDITINIYFNSLENLEEHIISDLFDIFKEYLRVLIDNKYE